MKWLALAIGLTVMLGGVACGRSEEALDEATATATPQRTQTAGTPAPPTVTPRASGDTSCIPDPSDDIVFTDAEKQAIVRAAEADPTLSQLLGNVERDPLVAESAWPFADGVTFVTVSFALAEPVPVDADLPRLDMGGRGGECTSSQLPPPGYVVSQEHFQLDAGIISATIIYETGEVVDIFPVPRGSLEGLSSP